MRKTPNRKIDSFRRDHPELGSSPKGDNYGFFMVPFKGVVLGVIAHDGQGLGCGWEHVSVSLPDRCPTWEEMCQIKDLFWAANETVVQYHPQKSDYINRHPYCLHLWKQHGKEHKLPPNILVG